MRMHNNENSENEMSSLQNCRAAKKTLDHKLLHFAQAGTTCYCEPF